MQNAASYSTSAVTASTLPYVVVELSPEVLAALPRQDNLGPGVTIPSGSPEVRPGIGDVIGVTIYEAGAGGLFAGDAGRTSSIVELPLQVVDTSGSISVPYAGRIPVAGHSIAAIQSTIVSKLSGQAIQPQVVVTVREQHSGQVTVLGDVERPGQVGAGRRLRVLDAIAMAGGLKQSGRASKVTIRRGSYSNSVSFRRLVESPRDNIRLTPGDVLYVSKEPQTFLAFGAASRNAAIDIDADVVTLTEAVAKAQGMLDNRADPGAVFIYRLEHRDHLLRLGDPLPGYRGPLIPTIYTVNLSAPAGFFLADGFTMRPRDVLYVANAPSVQLNKLLEVVRNVTTPARDIASTALAVHTIGSGGASVATISAGP